LKIQLVREVPEAMKPRRIPIASQDRNRGLDGTEHQKAA
jgi:hypothetical protein